MLLPLTNTFLQHTGTSEKINKKKNSLNRFKFSTTEMSTNKWNIIKQVKQI